MKTVLLRSFWIFALVGFLFAQCKKDDPVPTKSSERSLTVPTIDGVVSVSVTYEASTYSYIITVPNGTDVTALKLRFTLSPNAISKPVLGSAQNFTNPVTYTVTAEDGTIQNYIIRVVVAKSTEKQIVEFKFAGLSPAVSATVDQATNKISAVVLAGVNLTTLVPTIIASPKATISPASGQAQNFTNPVSYTVTAENGTTQIYQVTLTRSMYYIDDADYSLRANVNGDKLILTATSKKGINFFPSFKIDVNLNTNLDSNIDRSYGISTDGDFCSQYLLDYRSSTFCGGSSSTGTFSVTGNNIVFTLPLSELLPANKDTVSIIASMYNPTTKALEYYPDYPMQASIGFFKNTFLIKVR